MPLTQIEPISNIFQKTGLLGNIEFLLVFLKAPFSWKLLKIGSVSLRDIIKTSQVAWPAASSLPAMTIKVVSLVSWYG